MFKISRFVKNVAFIIAAAAASFSLSYLVLAAWTEPLSSPPLDNISTPVNVSSTSQTKAGPLKVTSLFDTDDPTNSYFVNPSGDLLGNAAILNGNVGIGTTNPGTPLHVYSDNPSGIKIERITAQNSSIQYTNPGGSMYAGLNPSANFGIGSNIDLSNPYLIVLKTGNVGIGISGPGEKLDVNGNVRANAFFYSSDERLKENITRIESPLQKILKLNGISFNWKNSGDKSVGLTAQNVETVFPELVKTDSAGMKSVEYGNLVAPLIEAVKEQQKMIENQQKQINELKALIK